MTTRRRSPAGGRAGQGVVAPAGGAPDAGGPAGASEQSLLGSSSAEPERAGEILRPIHSFGPCMACGVPVADRRGKDLGRAKAM